MLKSYGWRIFLLLVCSMFVALPLASAESAGSASGSKLIQQENWFNSYWGLHLGMTSTDERSEFYATGPNGEAWMVSIAGDRFRLRDWHHQKPTVYTKELHYETSHMGGTQISKAIIDADGRLYDVSKNCYGISTVRFSGNLVINTDVFVVK